MTSKKSIKRSLLASLLALCLCVSMLAGTTFAWFTDSTASTGNIIASGTLEAKLLYSSDNVTFTDVEADDAEAVFNYDKWEPGYTDMKYIKVLNDGTLAFMWQLHILPNGIVGNIAEVIDVYVAEVGENFDYKTATYTNVGTLADMIAEKDGAAHGALLAEGSNPTTDTYERVGEVTLCIALHMREDAGNDYQNKSIGTDFSIQLIAKQYTEEEDSFNDQYDKDSDYRTIVTTSKELEAALALGGKVMLANDIELKSTVTVPAGVVAELDLNGKTINAPLDPNRTDGGHLYAIDNKGIITLTSSTVVVSRSGSNYGEINARGIYNYGTMTIENGTYNAIDTNGGAGVFNYGKLTVNGGTFGGYVGVNNQTGGTVTINDIYVAETLQYSIQNNGGTMTINNATALNGVYNSNGITTINDGTFYNSRSGCHVVYSWNTQLTVNGGTFHNNNSGNATIYTSGSSAETVLNGGKYSITKGETWTSNLIDIASSAVVTINGGEFSATPRVYSSTLNICGGSFENTVEGDYQVDAGATINISGGVFKDESYKNYAETYVADGFTVTEIDGLYYVLSESGVVVGDSTSLDTAINGASATEENVIYLTSGEYENPIDITIADLGTQKGDIIFKALEGTTPVITGTVTLGYRNQGVGAALWKGNVTFEGITFDHAVVGEHSISVQDVKSLTLINCKIIGDGETGITSPRGNGTGPSLITGCTFENAGIQITGNFGTGLRIEDCKFNNSCINVQAGNYVTVSDCVFDCTLSDANANGNFYVFRTNDNKLTINDCLVNIDCTVAEGTVPSADKSWAVMWQRQGGSRKWDVNGLVINMTESAIANQNLMFNLNGTTTAANAPDRVTYNDLSSEVNDIAKVIAKSKGWLILDGESYLDGAKQ